MLVRKLAMPKAMIVLLLYFSIYLAIQSVDAQSTQPPKREEGSPPKVQPKNGRDPQAASLLSASSENVSQQQRILEPGSTEKPIRGILRKRGEFRLMSNQERDERLCLLEQVIQRECKEMELQAALLDSGDTAQKFGSNPIKDQTKGMTDAIRKSSDALKKVLEEIHRARSNTTKPQSENTGSQEYVPTGFIHSQKSTIQRILDSINAPKSRAIRKVSFSEPEKYPHEAEALQVSQEAAIPGNFEKQRGVERMGRALTAAPFAVKYGESHKQLGMSEELFNKRKQLAEERKKYFPVLTAKYMSEAADMSSSRSDVFPRTSRLYGKSSESLYEAGRQKFPKSQEKVKELARSKSYENLHPEIPTTEESTVQRAQAKKPDLVIYHIETI